MSLDQPEVAEVKPTPVETNPVPGATVTVPAEQVIDQCMGSLFNIIRGLPGDFLTVQNAWGRLREANNWLRDAINDKKLHDAHMQAQREAMLKENAEAKRESVPIEEPAN